MAATRDGKLQPLKPGDEVAIRFEVMDLQDGKILARALDRFGHAVAQMPAVTCDTRLAEKVRED